MLEYRVCSHSGVALTAVWPSHVGGSGQVMKEDQEDLAVQEVVLHYMGEVRLVLPPPRVGVYAWVHTWGRCASLVYAGYIHGEVLQHSHVRWGTRWIRRWVRRRWTSMPGAMATAMA